MLTMYDMPFSTSVMFTIHSSPPFLLEIIIVVLLLLFLAFPTHVTTYYPQMTREDILAEHELLWNQNNCVVQEVSDEGCRTTWGPLDAEQDYFDDYLAPRSDYNTARPDYRSCSHRKYQNEENKYEYSKIHEDVEDLATIYRSSRRLDDQLSSHETRMYIPGAVPIHQPLFKPPEDAYSDTLSYWAVCQAEYVSTAPLVRDSVPENLMHSLRDISHRDDTRVKEIEGKKDSNLHKKHCKKHDKKSRKNSTAEPHDDEHVTKSLKENDTLSRSNKFIHAWMTYDNNPASLSKSTCDNIESIVNWVSDEEFDQRVYLLRKQSNTEKSRHGSVLGGGAPDMKTEESIPNLNIIASLVSEKRTQNGNCTNDKYRESSSTNDKKSHKLDSDPAERGQKDKKSMKLKKILKSTDALFNDTCTVKESMNKLYNNTANKKKKANERTKIWNVLKLAKKETIMHCTNISDDSGKQYTAESLAKTEGLKLCKELLLPESNISEEKRTQIITENRKIIEEITERSRTKRNEICNRYNFPSRVASKHHQSVDNKIHSSRNTNNQVCRPLTADQKRQVSKSYDKQQSTVNMKLNKVGKLCTQQNQTTNNEQDTEASGSRSADKQLSLEMNVTNKSPPLSKLVLIPKNKAKRESKRTKTGDKCRNTGKGETSRDSSPINIKKRVASKNSSCRNSPFVVRTYSPS